MCLISINSLLQALFMCAAVSNSYNVYNNNYLFVILLTQTFAILFTPFAQATRLVRYICIAEIFKPRLFSSHAHNGCNMFSTSVVKIQYFSLFLILFNIKTTRSVLFYYYRFHGLRLATIQRNANSLQPGSSNVHATYTCSFYAYEKE